MTSSIMQPEEISIGIICPLPIEVAAMIQMLDERYSIQQFPRDPNLYHFGRIGEHNVVIAGLPDGLTGIASATTVAERLFLTFRCVKALLLVGIGGGVPTTQNDMRLGDVAVSRPDGKYGGVVQYDFGKSFSEGRFEHIGALNSPPREVLSTLAAIKANHLVLSVRLPDYLVYLEASQSSLHLKYPGAENDILFQANYNHAGGSDCTSCDKAREIKRKPREATRPVIHYGTIASANQLMKDSTKRDLYNKYYDGRILCFEMEAAGLMNSTPCLVIRGISDYADSHKRKDHMWHGYAAAAAAAFAKEFINTMPSSRLNSMSTIAEAIASKDISHYQINFSLQGMPVTNKFVDRPSDIAELEHTLLPQQHNYRQKIFVLYGLGGIGKTQLAVDFARRYHQRFSSVFWLDGRSEDNLKQSIANCANRIPEGQISEKSRNYILSSEGNIDTVVTEVIDWLGRPNNTKWLLIFDNVDRHYQQHNPEPGAYDISRYLHGDHGSVLITTRLSQLAQLGDSRRLNKVDRGQACAIFQKWYGSSLDIASSEELLNLLDGLPLALAQAAAYLRESGPDIATYVQFYKQQWKDLMESHNQSSFPLLDYLERSVWTTWTISFDTIKARNKVATNLLLLWAFLDNKDLWHGLLNAAIVSAEHWPEWLQIIAANELRFIEAVKLLQSYSMIERLEDLKSYAMHPVVYKWASHMQSDSQKKEFMQLAVMLVGLSVPDDTAKEYWTIQRRLLPHAKCCSQLIFIKLEPFYNRERHFGKGSSRETMNLEPLLDAIHRLGILYKDLGKLEEAEEMYQCALKGREKAFGPDCPLTLTTVKSLGLLYTNQGKLVEAEEMYQRALKGYEKALGPDHPSTLDTVDSLGLLYTSQGKLEEAEEMYQRALKGREKSLGPDHPSTLRTVNNLGILYADQSKLVEAEEMYQRALKGREKAHGLDHPLTLRTVNNLGILYSHQGKLVEAEEMYQRSLQAYEKTLGPDHPLTLTVYNNLGVLYTNQCKLEEAEDMYQRALKGYEKALGPDHPSTLGTVNNLGLLYTSQGKLEEAEEMYQRALKGREKALGPDHPSTTLCAVNGSGSLGIAWI